MRPMTTELSGSEHTPAQELDSSVRFGLPIDRPKVEPQRERQQLDHEQLGELATTSSR